MPESTTYPGFTLERVHIDSIKVGDTVEWGGQLRTARAAPSSSGVA